MAVSYPWRATLRDVASGGAKSAIWATLPAGRASLERTIRRAVEAFMPLKRRTGDEWERGWAARWRKKGPQAYELPVKKTDHSERAFLAESRTPEKEKARLKRIQNEFVRGFKGLYQLGPAVTVFGSARFKEN